MINIVLFGPPGAGKGTQAVKLVEKFGLIHLSTGDIFRSNIRFGTELGLLAKNYMDQGNLVPDEVTIRMLESEVEKHPGAKGFIFDGFPRTTAQAQALDALLHGKGTSIAMTLALEVDEEELTRRILERGKSSGRADDQDADTVRNRVNEYNNKTAPLKHFYQGQGKLHIIQGVGGIDDIFNMLVNAIEHVMAERNVNEEIHRIFERPVAKSTSAKKAKSTPSRPVKKKKVPAKRKAAAKKKKPAKKKVQKKKKPVKKARPKKSSSSKKKTVLKKKSPKRKVSRKKSGRKK